METKKKIGIAVGIGLVIGVAILATRHSIKKKGYSKSKIFAKMFDVPYVEKMYGSLDEQNKNIADSASENEATKGGIEFRADGSNPKARKFTKLDDCMGQCIAPKQCYKGVCI